MGAHTAPRTCTAGRRLAGRGALTAVAALALTGGTASFAFAGESEKYSAADDDTTSCDSSCGQKSWDDEDKDWNDRHWSKSDEDDCDDDHDGHHARWDDDEDDDDHDGRHHDGDRDRHDKFKKVYKEGFKDGFDVGYDKGSQKTASGLLDLGGLLGGGSTAPVG